MTCAHYVDYILEREGDVAAVIGEPIRCTPIIPKPDYWQTIRPACDRHGALLIFDEIPHSLGRTGRMFTFENSGSSRTWWSSARGSAGVFAAGRS